MEVIVTIVKNIFLLFVAVGKVVIGLFYVVLDLFSPQKDPHDRTCYEVGRVLTERELIDRLLFKNKAAVLSYDEKRKEMQRRGGLYPECCQIENFDSGWQTSDVHEGPSYAPPHYVLYAYFPNPVKEMSGYKKDIILINECGGELHEMTGSYSTTDDIDEKEYQEAIKKIGNFWKDKMGHNKVEI